MAKFNQAQAGNVTNQYPVSFKTTEANLKEIINVWADKNGYSITIKGEKKEDEFFQIKVVAIIGFVKDVAIKVIVFDMFVYLFFR